jgi:hypothetical protein
VRRRALTPRARAPAPWRRALRRLTRAPRRARSLRLFTGKVCKTKCNHYFCGCGVCGARSGRALARPGL